MNGPEHYREAERLLGAIEARKLGSNETFAAIEMAQVHATLALAAATVDAVGYTDEVRNETAWTDTVRRPTVNRPDTSARAMLDDCTDTSGCPSSVHISECPARRARS